MGELMRFGMSLERDLLRQFDALIKKEGYTNRSEAIRDLIRERFAKKEWECDRTVVGVVAIVYDHHRPGLMERLTELQHHYGRVICSTHVHLAKGRCLEILAVRDKSSSITALAHNIKSIKGVDQCSVAMCALTKHK
jgi:CopG family nickel-responsive transcriptional regulator